MGFDDFKNFTLFYFYEFTALIFLRTEFQEGQSLAATCSLKILVFN